MVDSKHRRRLETEADLRTIMSEPKAHCPKAFLRSKLWDSVQSTDSASAADVAALEREESAFLAESPFVLR